MKKIFLILLLCLLTSNCAISSVERKKEYIFETDKSKNKFTAWKYDSGEAGISAFILLAKENKESSYNKTFLENEEAISVYLSTFRQESSLQGVWPIIPIPIPYYYQNKSKSMEFADKNIKIYVTLPKLKKEKYSISKIYLEKGKDIFEPIKSENTKNGGKNNTNMEYTFDFNYYTLNKADLIIVLNKDSNPYKTLSYKIKKKSINDFIWGFVIVDLRLL